MPEANSVTEATKYQEDFTALAHLSSMPYLCGLKLQLKETGKYGIKDTKGEDALKSLRKQAHAVKTIQAQRLHFFLTAKFLKRPYLRRNQ